MPQVALIPPTSLIDYDTSGLGLALPELAGDTRQREHWEKKWYTILDNGAAEPSGSVTLGSLLTEALLLDADELALPDVIRRRTETQDKVLPFFQAEMWRMVPSLNIGYVAQGEDPDDAILGTLAILRVFGEHIHTIYIPRHLGRFGREARAYVASELKERYDHKIYHLFGCYQEDIYEVKTACEKAPFIRGVDTSAPFTAAMEGRSIEDGQPCHRQKYYFEYQPGPGFDYAQLKKNIETFKEWANDRTETSIREV